MADFLERLTSRKFLLAVAGVIYLLAVGEQNLATYLMMGYLAAEGLPDVASRLNGNGK